VFKSIVGDSTNTTRRQLAMATDRAAGTMIYRCEVPRASRSCVSCSLDDPTATAAAVVAAAVAVAAPAAVVAPSAYGLLAWSSVSPTLLSFAHPLSLTHSHVLSLPLTPYRPFLLLLSNSHRGKRLIALSVYSIIGILCVSHALLSAKIRNFSAIHQNSID